MSLAADLLQKESAKKIAEQLDNGYVGSKDFEVRKVILNYKLQRQLIVATWFLAVSTVLISIGSIAYVQMGQEGLQRELATLEARSLMTECFDTVWNYGEQPDSPAQAFDWVYKCIHQYASLEETRKILEENDYSLDIVIPSMVVDGSRDDFKN